MQRTVVSTDWVAERKRGAHSHSSVRHRDPHLTPSADGSVSAKGLPSVLDQVTPRDTADCFPHCGYNATPEPGLL